MHSALTYKSGTALKGEGRNSNKEAKSRATWKEKMGLKRF